MLLDRSSQENPNSTSEKDRYIDLFKSVSDRITYSDDDANPDDYFMSCREIKDKISELSRNPYLYDVEDHRRIPFDCFLCPKTGGMMTLRLLVRKNRIRLDDFLSDADMELDFDRKFDRFVSEIKKGSLCERRAQLEVMKSTQRTALEQINSTSDEVEETILEEVKNE